MSSKLNIINLQTEKVLRKKHKGKRTLRRGGAGGNSRNSKHINEFQESTILNYPLTNYPLK